MEKQKLSKKVQSKKESSYKMGVKAEIEQKSPKARMQAELCSMKRGTERKGESLIFLKNSVCHPI